MWVSKVVDCSLVPEWSLNTSLSLQISRLLFVVQILPKLQTNPQSYLQAVPMSAELSSGPSWYFSVLFLAWLAVSVKLSRG